MVSSVVRLVVGLDPEHVEPEGVEEQERCRSVIGFDSLELGHVEPEGVQEQKAQNFNSVIGLDSPGLDLRGLDLPELGHVEPEGVREPEDSKPVQVVRCDSLEPEHAEPGL